MFGFIGTKDSLNKRSSFFTNSGYPDSLDFKFVKFGTKINGISVSIGGTTETFNSGVIVNGLSGTAYKTSGVQISGLLNLQYEFRGLLIAGLVNKTKKGRGVQIALLNNCESGHVFQIGLINRIGKRILPLINFSYKKEK